MWTLIVQLVEVCVYMYAHCSVIMCFNGASYVWCRYLLHCLHSLWGYLTGRAASRTCSVSHSSTESPRMQRASTPRYTHAHLRSACTYTHKQTEKSHAASEIKSVKFALCIRLVVPCLWDWWVMPAVCLGRQRVNKSGMETDVSMATPNEIHRARIRKSFIFRRYTSNPAYYCMYVSVCVQYRRALLMARTQWKLYVTVRNCCFYVCGGCGGIYVLWH